MSGPKPAVELKAWLEGGRVFLTDQELHCFITLTNISDNERRSSSSSDTESEHVNPRLAWLGAQIYCICVINESRVLPPKVRRLTDPNTASPTTSFVPTSGEKGYCIHSTPSTILLCDLPLNPQQSKTVTYHEKIPLGPPSFSGGMVRYVYKLVVGAQIVGRSAKLIKLPLQVIPLTNKLYIRSPAITEVLQTNPDGIANPFIVPLTKQSKEKSNAFIASVQEALFDESSRKSTRSYNLKQGIEQGDIICTVYIVKPVHALGDEIVISLDFKQATKLRSARVIVFLETVEEVNQDNRRSSGINSPEKFHYVTEHAMHAQDTMFLTETHLSLPIPLQATPSFKTSLVTVKWQLRFIFLTTGLEIFKPDTDGFQLINANPNELKSVIWELPVVVIPSYPGPALLDNPAPCEVIRL
ncbi:RAB6A-GEF complex partner protein 2 [Oopsacas minuta]|uniref:RAB6A-GEF complex partner protein 2 n=1 Tax=Oopsacas minuta TaxID=111878 RepID=A0AAV7K808_9METZ|nr:RAB6A-GEF complex partner protein 2 [Oopsacas minuta]